MTSTTIRKCTVEEIQNASNIDALMVEYASESQAPELPKPNVQWGHYQALENLGVLGAFAAFVDDQIIGFISVVSNKLPHHGATLSIVESFFVAKQYRKLGPGIKLLDQAEQHAREVGSPCLIVTAPCGGALEKVMPRLGYRQSHSSFVRSV